MAQKRTAPGDFVAGIGLLGRGFRMWGRSPRLMLLGLLPALLSFAVLTTAFVLLCVFVQPITGVLTPFADRWSDGAREAVRVIVGVALLGSSLLVAILSYTALTLAIGDPFFQSIARRAEDADGGAPPEVEVAWWRSLGRGLRDALRMVLTSVITGVLLFAIGFIPVVGQVLAPVLGAIVGGWYLAIELTTASFERRGLRLRDRRRALRGRRALTLGFGVGAFLLFMIPLGAVLAMPGAVAGAALLSRRCLGVGPGERSAGDPALMNPASRPR